MNLKCKTKYCRGKRNRKSKNLHCPKCASRIWREKNPCNAAYISKKADAKRKRILFLLTLEQFETVWIKGKVIDRINPLEGYHIDNVQSLTGKENAVKGATYDKELHEIYVPF